MATVTENNYKIKENIGKDILKNFFEDEYYNCVDAGEKEICYSDLRVEDAIIFLEELKKQFNKEVNKRIIDLKWVSEFR